MNKIKYDYGKLKDRMKEKGIKQLDLAKQLGLAESTLSIKMNNGNYFTQEEISKTIDILSIPKEIAQEYFFTEKV